MSRPSLQLRIAHSAPLGYGLAILSVAIASGFAFLEQTIHAHDVAVPICLIGIAVTAWYAGPGPAILAVVISVTLFDYYFVEPRYSLAVTLADLPYLIIFITFASLVAWFSAVRRRVERDLRDARDKLEIEGAERTQQANLLNLTSDMIFVRDMDDLITYWNRGALEMYGYTYTPEQAIGKRSHELLRTVFPVALDVIAAELQRTGHWEGELRHTKADGTQVMVSSRWALQRDPQGRPLAVLETNNDITERSRRDIEVRTLNERLANRSAQLEATNKQIKSDAKLKMIPVVVLNSSKEEKDMVTSYKLGVNAYVVKPVDFHEFVNAIKELGVFWAVINQPPPGSLRK